MSEDKTTGDDTPIINFSGEKVALGPGRKGERPLMLRWLNDLNLGVMAGAPVPFLRPLSTEAFEAWLDSRTKGESGQRTAFFTIYERAGLRPIGVASLRDIDHDRSTAEFGITIAAQEDRGHGYGTEATFLMLDYGFHILGLHSIMLTTWHDNAGAIAAYTRAGFKPIGVRREAARRSGQFTDILYMDCLAAEFHSPLPPVYHGPSS